MPFFRIMSHRLLVFSHAAVLGVNRALFWKISEVSNTQVRLIVPQSWKGDLIADLQFHSEPEDRRIEVVPLPVAFSGKGSFFFYSQSLKKHISDFRPDHVFVYEEPWSFSVLQAFWAARGYSRSFFTNQNLKKKLPLPFELLQRWIFSNADHGYTVSDETADVLRWKGDQGEIRLLPFSYDPTLFYPRSDAERTQRRESLGLGRDDFIISYFGRMQPEKGIDDLVEAIFKAEGEPDLKRARFLIVGNGRLLESTRQKLSPLIPHRVTVLPAVPHHQVPEVLSAVDILSLPSRTTKTWKEQFGRILIEAMACGAATVGSDSGEIPHLIRKTKGGLVFHEGDPNDLLKQWVTLARDPALLLEKKTLGQRYVSSNFTHDAVARSFIGKLGFQLK